VAGRKDGKPSSGNNAPGIGCCVESVSASLTKVLRLAEAWLTGCDWQAARSKITLNTQLEPTTLTGEDLNAVVAAWRAGAISRETLLEALKRGDVLPDGRSVTDEKKLLYRAAAVGVG
jgi:hypothetical protein